MPSAWLSSDNGGTEPVFNGTVIYGPVFATPVFSKCNNYPAILLLNINQVVFFIILQSMPKFVLAFGVGYYPYSGLTYK